MILRRFMKHVTDQNWFAVGLDVIVVITGIFLGMQVTEWNEDRKDMLKEKAVLEALFKESYERLAYLEAEVSEFASYVSGQEASIQALIKGELPADMSHEEFVKGVTLTRRLAPPSPPSSIYNSIIATGEIRLIRNQKIVLGLANLQAQLASVKEYAGRLYNTPEVREPYHRAIVSIYDPALPGKRRQDADFKILAGDPDFLEQSVDILRAVAILQSARRGLLAESQKIHLLLCHEASLACSPPLELNQ